METSILTPKGQLLIPKRIRVKYGIKSGIKVAFLETPQGLIIKPMDAAYFENFAGLYKDSLPSTQEYKELKKEEKKFEDEKDRQDFQKVDNEKMVFDSYALISFFRKEPGYELIRDLLVKIANNESEGYMSSINVGEIYYMLVRKVNIKVAEAAIVSLKQFPLHFVDPDFKMCLDAAALKAKFSFSYADAFAAALTIVKKAVLITGDKAFDALKGETGFKVQYL